MPDSAGILLFRRGAGRALEVLLGHPGGPLWARRDEGAWSIPKGLVDPGEDMYEAALREFEEEVGLRVTGEALPLGSVRLKSGKIVHAWAVEGDMEPSSLVSNTFDMEWPRGSGQTATFPELDRVAWFDVDVASRKLNPAQVAFVERLVTSLRSGGAG